MIERKSARTPGGRGKEGGLERLGRMTRRMALIAALAGAACTPSFATCGSAICFLVTGTREGVAEKGIVTADLSYQYIDQDRGLEGTRDAGDVLVPKVNFEEGVLELGHHREVRTRTTLVQLDLSYSLSSRFALAGNFPLINDRQHEHFDDAGTPGEHFEGGDGTSGFGDVQLAARYVFLTRPLDLVLGSAGVKLPTGAYKLLDSEGAINEPTIQPGTGSVDAFASVYYSHRLEAHPIELFTSGSYRVNAENPLDYRIGNEAILNAGVSSVATIGRLSWGLQINARRTERDQFLGNDVPSTGATYVNLTPGLRFYSSSRTSLYGFVQIPVHQDVNEAQLAPRYGIVAGVSREF